MPSRRLPEKHGLANKILEIINVYLGERGLLLRQGGIVDAAIIHIPSSTMSTDGMRDPEMHQARGC
ncbi:hypothetical protein D3C85_1920480 [compost metagenome]